LLQLEDVDFDTGKPTRPGEYRIADDTYAELTIRLADKSSIDRRGGEAQVGTNRRIAPRSMTGSAPHHLTLVSIFSRSAG